METAERIARYLLKSISKANRANGSISNGDRIAVGVSGGKDSRPPLVAYRGERPDLPRSGGRVLARIDLLPYGEQANRVDMKTLLQTNKDLLPQAQVKLFRAVERAQGWRVKQKDK